GLLSKGHFIEAERADLVGEYIGQTAQKTRSIIRKAMGGILFVDEAYSLGRGGEKDFRKEAIDTLVKHMEDHHNDFVLIMAGDPYEMERFLSLNPGLASRFAMVLDIQDYDVDRLMEIADQKADEVDNRLTQEETSTLRLHLYRKMQGTRWNFSNARYVRNVMERAIRAHAVRLLSNKQVSDAELMELTGNDFDGN